MTTRFSSTHEESGTFRHTFRISRQSYPISFRSVPNWSSLAHRTNFREMHALPPINCRSFSTFKDRRHETRTSDLLLYLARTINSSIEMRNKTRTAAIRRSPLKSTNHSSLRALRLMRAPVEAISGLLRGNPARRVWTVKGLVINCPSRLVETRQTCRSR